MKFSFSLLLLLSFSLTQANTFYVDASTTSSTQNGSLANPWKTLSQVNSNMGSFNAGDFILFKRGGTFTGTLTVSRSGSAGNPITFGAYGTGNKPSFTGTGSSIGYLIFSSKSYLTFRDWQITDPSIDNTNRSIDSKIERAFTFEGTNCKIISCDIELVGVAGYFVGGTNTMDSCDVGNLRMVVDTDDGNQPGNDDDYGANPLVISSGNNTITHNYFHDCWATSFDYDYDGGAIEFYGDGTDNNFIGYNTIYDCIGLTEVTGNSSNNTYTYNKIINNGSLLYFQSGSSYSGYKFYNNVIIENVATRVSESRLIGGSFSSGAVILKNNIFHLSNGVDVANSSGITHEDNIYKLSNSSVAGYTMGATELTTTATIFTNTTPSDPISWNFAPSTGSPAIDFGQNVGQAKDFAGNPVPAIPNSGILESGGSTPPSTLSAASTAGIINCNGGTTTVTVTGSGGTAPYIGTGTFTVSAGTYNYTITDAAGTTNTTSITVSQPAAVAASLSAGTITAPGGTTIINVNASGGTGAFTYKLNSGSYQSGNTFQNVTAGTYTITVKDANGCTTSKNITITEPAGVVLSATSSAGTINCFGGTTTVTVSATGGTTPYTGTGAFTVSAGTYNYTVTDAAGSTKITSVTVTQPAALSVSVTAGTVSSPTGTTTATVNVSGGTPNYSYSINGGAYQSSNIFNNVAAGNQSVTIKDGNGCTAVKTFTVAIATGSPLIVTSVGGSINCNGGTTTITVSATGGKPPYVGTGTFTVNGGTYTYTVADGNGTVGTTTIIITQPAAITATVTAGTITTTGGSTTISVTATGGMGAYTYMLDGGAYQSGNTFTNVLAGTHTVTVKDGKGCTAVQSVTITQPSGNAPLTIVLVSSTNVTCKGRRDGTITVSASGGTAPYLYRTQWIPWTTDDYFTNLRKGTYVCTVKDATGATASISVTILGSNIRCDNNRSGSAGRPGTGEISQAAPADDDEKPGIDGLKINAYPNPTATEFSLVVENGSQEEARIVVMNLNGQKVYEGRSRVFEKNNFGKNFISGIYIVKVTQGKNTQTLRLVKAK